LAQPVVTITRRPPVGAPAPAARLPGASPAAGSGLAAPGLAGARLEGARLAAPRLAARAFGVQRAAAEPSEPAARAEPAAARSPAARALVVDDDATELAPGQMRKRELLATLRGEVCAAVDADVAAGGQTTRGCPYLDRWFGHYEQQDAAHVERALRRYVPAAAEADSAAAYVPFVVARARRSAAEWRRTGQVGELPEGISLDGPDGGLGATIASGIARAASAVAQGIGSLVSGIGRLFFKPRDDRAPATMEPHRVAEQLGPGSSLDPEVRGRMESAFGHDFARVRVHADRSAAALSEQLGARAFTVGDHVAFAAGEFLPGTLHGDALLSHELAHVVQQQGAGTGTPAPLETKVDGDGGGGGALEEDADTAAAGAVISLWGGAAGAAGTDDARSPRLRSALRLSRCGGPGAARRPDTPLTADAFSRMTPWELSQTPESAVAAFPDYARARRVALDTFRQLGIRQDPDRGTPAPVGREPSAEQQRAVDTQLRAILGTYGIQALVNAGRIPTAGDPPRPSLAGRVRQARNRLEFAVKQYEHDRWFANNVPINQAEVLRKLRESWPQAGYGDSTTLVPQEILLSLWITPPAEGFYNPADDNFYLGPEVDLSNPANLEVVRHETVHLLGGRDATIRAFLARLRPTQGARWFHYWHAFEEGIAQIVALDSAPPGTTRQPAQSTSSTTRSGGGTTTVTVTSEGAYTRQVDWIRSIMAAAPDNRALLLRAYFSGSVPEEVFTLLLDARRFGAPPSP
jgi:hypothetical protein